MPPLQVADAQPCWWRAGKVQAYTGDASRLNIAEQFIQQVLLGVSDVQRRLRTMLFLSSVSEELASKDADIEVLLSACQEVRAASQVACAAPSWSFSARLT